LLLPNAPESTPPTSKECIQTQQSSPQPLTSSQLPLQYTRSLQAHAQHWARLRAATQQATFFHPDTNRSDCLNTVAGRATNQRDKHKSQQKSRFLKFMAQHSIGNCASTGAVLLRAHH
jgi:hypothetical protein